jgi:3-hydroxyisobutyrate dehydrogenase
MRIGFIGLGAMGRPMAASLQRAGHDLQVHDLRRVEGFANFKASVTEAAKDCEVLFTSLPGPAEVAAIAPQIQSVKAWFDLSTNSPAKVRELHQKLQRKGIQLLDAPVSGGPRGAESGKLAIWVGGDPMVFEKFKPILKAIGDQPYYVGPIGAGTVAKLAHNAASFTVQAALAEIFTLGVKAGVEPLALFKALRQGATGRKRTFDRLPEHFLPGVYDPPAFTLQGHVACHGACRSGGRSDENRPGGARRACRGDAARVERSRLPCSDDATGGARPGERASSARTSAGCDGLSSRWHAS